jgi:hypothetical protein
LEESDKEVDHASSSLESIDFDVFTPFFFTHLVHYVHTVEAVTACTITAREENKLLHISQPEILPRLFPTRISKSRDSTLPGEAKSATAKVPQSPITPPTSAEEFEWRFLRFTRYQAPRPPAQAYPTVLDRSSSSSKKIEDIRPQSLSDLDKFVCANYDTRDRMLYREAVITTLEGSLLGFNTLTFLKVIYWAVRIYLVWVAASSIRRAYVGDFSGFSELGILCFWLNALNIVAFLKGIGRFFAVRSAFGVADEND